VEGIEVWGQEILLKKPYTLHFVDTIIPTTKNGRRYMRKNKVGRIPVDEIKLLLKLDGMTWTEKMESSNKWRVAIKHPNLFGMYIVWHGDTQEDVWQSAWEQYNDERR